MSLYSDPLEGLVKSVNSLNNLELVAADYHFDTPVALQGGSGTNNTQITVTAKGVESPYDGSVTLTYRRLDLADIAKLITPTVRLYQPKDTLDVAIGLNESYGFAFDADDIVVEDLTLTDGEGVVTLRAVDGSIGWIGQVDITVVKGNYPITQFVTTTKLPGLNYPAPTTAKPYAAMYSYWRDFSARKADLQGVGLGNGGMGTIQSVLKEITGDDWRQYGSSRFSLDGAMVTYAGLTQDNPDLNQTRYTHGIVVALTDSCLGFAGNLILHYKVDDL